MLDRKTPRPLILWCCVATLILSFWAFAEYKESGAVPWFPVAFWIGLPVFLFGLLYWLTTRRFPPDVEALIQEASVRVAFEKSVCGRCASPLKPQAVFCGSCRKVVDWGLLVMIGLFVLPVFGFLLFLYVTGP